MTKKVIAACLALVIMSGLAYYSSYIFSSRQFREQSEQIEAQLEAKEQALIPENPPAETDRVQQETKQSQEQTLETEKQETATDPESVQAETENFSYYLVEEFGYINIYLADQETIYEYTDIPIDSLPDALQVEICTGKGLASEQELYDFLENYSS